MSPDSGFAAQVSALARRSILRTGPPARVRRSFR